MIGYRFVPDHRAKCRVVGVSRSGFYAWAGRYPSKRSLADQELLVEIREIHQTSRRIYGSPRIHKQFRDRGRSVSHNRVACLMRANHLVKACHHHRRGTTMAEHSMKDRLEDLERRKNEALHAGPQRAVDRQHGKGKMLARERIEYLLDDGSFHELDMLARHRALDSNIEERPYTDGVITGWGTIDGRKVFLFSQDFTAEIPDRKWVADITGFGCAETKVHLANILDLCDHNQMGWSIAEHQTTELVVNALTMAIARRQPEPGLMHHNDHGTQYTSMAFTDRFPQADIVGSWGIVG